MDEINIYFSDDSELSEYEATNKGYRVDVYVIVNSRIYNVRVYTMIRLQQDFESDMEDYGIYLMEPNMILVKDSNKQEIIDTIIKLNEQDYFNNIKPIENIDLNKLIKVK